MKELTYRDILDALNELTFEQLNLPVKVAIGRKLKPLYSTALSCECKGPAVKLVGENYPLLIANETKA